MTRCEMCGTKASVRIARQNVCWHHYNLLLKTGAKGEMLKRR